MADWTNDVNERKKKLSSIGQQITDYKPFRYDAESDPVYRQMADRYVQMGKQANRNAQGQAAAMTGGYGNSYASQVGNQMYQQYLTALNDQLPTLQANAQNAWANGFDQLLQQYQLLQALGTGGGGSTTSGSAESTLIDPSVILSQVIGNKMSGTPTLDEQMQNMYADWLKRTTAASGK